MAAKTDFKTVETDSGELEELNEKIRSHRHKTIRRVAIVLIILAAVLIGLQLWMALRSYTSFEVTAQTTQQDSSASKFEAYLGNILEYNNDGIVCRGTDNKLIWNQSFEMTTPTLAVCDRYLAVYDRGGTSIYIIAEKGVVHKIETTTPINSVCIAGQGTVAVLMKEDNVSYVRLYDKKGKELAGGEFYEEKESFPVDIALSPDGQKLAVDMLDVTEGKVRSTISFYNFGSVGQNEIDNNVGTYSYDDIFIPEIEYMGADRMMALSSQGFMIFDGKQKPAPKKEVKFDGEMQSVFHNSRYIGVTYSNPQKEGCWHIKVYDTNGNIVMENDTALAYTRIEFLDNNEICVRDDYHCEIFTIHSIRKFAYTFDKELYKILSGSDTAAYTFIMKGEIDEVRLK